MKKAVRTARPRREKMIGAVIGDIVGSRFEFLNYRAKDFRLFERECFPTDDSIMTIAVGKALVECDGNYSDLAAKTVESMQELGRPYPHCGYGGSFYYWMYSDHPQPYNSFGNGAAMRVSGVGFAARSLEEVKALSHAVTAVSHNHPEGLKGAESVAMAIFLARQGKTMREIRRFVEQNYYAIDFTLDEIRDTYQFNETCQNTVPQAFEAFFEAKDFEDAIRNAISIGGDSDTLAAITGGMAEAYFGVPQPLREEAEKYLDNDTYRPLYVWLKKFEAKFG